MNSNKKSEDKKSTGKTKNDIARLISSGVLSLSLIERELCKRSFYYFVQTFWSVVIAEKPRYNWHIKYLCDELQAISGNLVSRKPKENDLLINIPPGTTKSTIVTIMFPAWLWALDASIRIISNSYSSDISTEHAIKSRDIILSVKYKELFPEVEIRRDKSGKQSYDTTANGARYTTSTGGSITGKHAHLIINDDAQNPKQAESEAHRKQAVDHTKTLASRKVDKEVAVTVTVMQRLNAEDVSGYLLNNKKEGLKHIKLPSEITDKTKPIPAEDEFLFDGKKVTVQQMYELQDNLLDNVRLSRKAINEALVDLGSRGYNGQFLQNPTAEGGDIIKKDWIQIITKQQFDLLAHNKRRVVHFFIDTAYTDKTENDPTGIIAVVQIGNNIYITGAIKIRKEFPELIKFIPEWCKANGYSSGSTVRIEPKASGKSVVQTLKRETNLNVTETPSPKDDKKTRLNGVSPKYESGRVILVEGTWNDDYIAEVTGFPNASHDEYVDVSVYAINHFLTAEAGKGIVSNILW